MLLRNKQDVTDFGICRISGDFSVYENGHESKKHNSTMMTFVWDQKLGEDSDKSAPVNNLYIQKEIQNPHTVSEQDLRACTEVSTQASPSPPATCQKGAGRGGRVVSSQLGGGGRRK